MVSALVADEPLSLLEKLKLAAPAPKVPDGWKPMLDVGESGGTITTRPVPIGSELEGGVEPDSVRILKEHNLSPAQWKITSYRRGSWQSFDGSWLEAWKISIAPAPGYGTGLVLPDLHDLQRSIQTAVASAPPRRTPGNDQLSTIAVLADLQVGKVDSRGGTEELLFRIQHSLLAWEEQLQRIKPAEIVLLDAGDSTEGFENTAAQARTNDLPLTEQLRIWYRVFWSWIEVAARNASVVKVGAVSSNHTRVRAGKNYLSHPNDDYGLLTLQQLAFMASEIPEKYGHVSFFAPNKFEETLTIQLMGGKYLGLVHGHQANSIEGLPKWWANQSHGRSNIGAADVLVAGHFHNFRVQNTGNDRYLMVAPTSDNGSSWYRNTSGNDSAPNVLTFGMDEAGIRWKDLELV